MDFNDNKPIYLQLADQIMDEIVHEEIPEGGRLLSVREFASRSGVNANTVMRAYTMLQQSGIIYNQRGIGYFNTPEARKLILQRRRMEMLGKEIFNFMDKLIELKISPEEFNKIYSDYLCQKNK